jgi:hypothetical protein
MTEPFSRGPEVQAMITAMRQARAAMHEAEKALGFDLNPDWIPLQVPYTAVSAFFRKTITVRSDVHTALRIRAIVVHGFASRFSIYSIRVGKNKQFSDSAYPIGCEQLAYDNPPRLINLPDAVQTSQDVTIEVENHTAVAEGFSATLWGEKLP